MNIPFPPANPGACVVPQEHKPQPVGDAARLFAREYVKDFKTARAAGAVGMSSSWGYAQLADPRVVAIINENKKRHQETVDASIDATLENLVTYIRVSVADYFSETIVTPDPIVDLMGRLHQPAPYMVRDLVPMSEWSDDMRAACKSVKQTKEGWQIEMFDKLAANVHVGRFFNMFADTTKLVGPGGGPLQMIAPTMTADEAARMYADTLNGAS